MAEANPPVDTPPAQEPGAQPGALVDPFRAYNFKLLIDGVTEGRHHSIAHGLYNRATLFCNRFFQYLEMLTYASKRRGIPNFAIQARRVT